MEDRLKQQLSRIGYDFGSLHALMTDSFSNIWTGEAYSLHIDAECSLYHEAMEAVRSGQARLSRPYGS